jgi:hypothetical protein
LYLHACGCHVAIAPRNDMIFKKAQTDSSECDVHVA